MKFRRFFFIYSLILVIAITCMFFIKSKVQHMKKSLIVFEKQVSQKKENIQVLKSEWAYLASPKKIKELAEKYLNLSSIDKNQIAILDKDSVQ